jgi:outer membrane protein OmpA-like peptidoglycan-associated protein
MTMLAGSLYAQEQKSVLQLADEAYAREEYAVAGALYKRQARSKGNKTPVGLLMKMAHSYQEIGLFGEAGDIYRRIIERPGHPAAAYFAYGDALRQLEQYDAARQQYALFNTSNADSLKLKAIALQGCDSAAIWKQQPASAQLQAVKELNTAGSDIVSGTIDNSLLLMSSGYRKLVPQGATGNAEKDLRTQQPYYKAYIYQQFLEELAPELLGKFDYHVGPVCMNRTGDTLYATINIQGKGIPLTSRKGPVNGVRQLQIYQSVKTDGKWSPMVLLPGINMAGYSSSHAALNAAGNILYFVSDRPGGVGQADIWYCEKQADSSWGTPVNCGDRINTIASETFPTVNEDGLLYFSSKGHPGFGGYDIYRAKGEKASWETPGNMKVPFNSGADDIGLVLEEQGQKGYMSSNRTGGMGSDDIYYFNRLVQTSPPVARENNNVQVPRQATSNPVTKQHTAEEEEDKRQLEELKFLYDFNSARLLAESKQILDKAADVLKRHPDWKVMVASYADARGSDEYNINLSALRCFAVIDYLTKKGISPARLYYNNKGEHDPVNACKDGVPCSEEEYRLNRRSELTIKW